MTDATLFSDVRNAYRLLHRYHEAARDTIYRLNEAFGSWTEIGNGGFVGGHSSRRTSIITHSEYWIWDWLPYHSAHLHFSRNPHTFLTMTLCTDTSIFDPLTGKTSDDLDKAEPDTARTGLHIDFAYSTEPRNDDLWDLEYLYEEGAEFQADQHIKHDNFHRFRRFIDFHTLGTPEGIDKVAKSFREFVERKCEDAAAHLKSSDT